MRQFVWILNGLVILIVALSLPGCSKIKREFILYQATQAHDKGDYQRAIDKYQKVLEISPEDDSVLYNLGVAYIYNNQLKKARQQVEILKKLDHDDYANLLQELIDKSAEIHTSE